MLIYNRLVRFSPGMALPAHKVSRNARTSPYLWLLTGIAALPAVLFWKNTPLLMALCIAFALGYCEVYRSIVKFRAHKWLHRRIPVAVPEVVESKA